MPSVVAQSTWATTLVDGAEAPSGRLVPEGDFFSWTSCSRKRRRRIRQRMR